MPAGQCRALAVFARQLSCFRGAQLNCSLCRPTVNLRLGRRSSRSLGMKFGADFAGSAALCLVAHVPAIPHQPARQRPRAIGPPYGRTLSRRLRSLVCRRCGGHTGPPAPGRSFAGHSTGQEMQHDRHKSYASLEKSLHPGCIDQLFPRCPRHSSMCVNSRLHPVQAKRPLGFISPWPSRSMMLR